MSHARYFLTEDCALFINVVENSRTSSIGQSEMQITEEQFFSQWFRLVVSCFSRPINVHAEFAQSLLGLSNSKEECGLSNDTCVE
jgi:hypothetical protein